ncbi:MAG: rRNA maturation RNase YbeY [Verrucomicrobia bacterium]|nr:rRNA maturation RNase YbeY [Verrucomicrobiota bacterium]
MNELVFRNRQKHRRIRLSLLKSIAKTLLAQSLQVPSFQLGVSLISDEEMTLLNETFLNHEGSTDVVTFDHRDAESPELLYGEICISVPDAVLQARQYKTSWQSEIVRYLIHGLLHLRGYDDIDPAHRRTMKRRERTLLNAIAKQFPIDELALR